MATYCDASRSDLIHGTAGIATWDRSTPEVSSGPPTTLHGALSARKWLDGQISPPRHPAPARVCNPAAITLPLLMPPAAAQEGRPTPRLATAHPGSQVQLQALPVALEATCKLLHARSLRQAWGWCC